MSSLRTRLLAFWLFFLFTLTMGCAKRGFPPGGPADVTPPQIELTSPANGTTAVAADAKVTLQFSEKMNQKTVENSIFVSPSVEFKTTWKGETLFLESEEELALARTYVVTLGPDCQDLEGNKLGTPFSFAFSTGTTIDSGSVSGSVFYNGKREAGVSLWAYRLEQGKDILPWEKKPDYATQSDRDGKFDLSYLSPGAYRLFALKDANRNQLWDPASEPLGLAHRDITFKESTPAAQEGFMLACVNRDTSALALLNCQALDKNRLKLTFNKELADPDHINKADIRVVSQTGDSLNLLGVYQVYGQKRSVFLRVPELNSKMTYTIRVKQIASPDASLLDPGHYTCQFAGIQTPDRTLPEIVHQIPGQNQKDVNIDQAVLLYFSEPISFLLVEQSGVHLSDSGGKEFSVYISWTDDLTVGFTPSQELRPNSIYTFKLKGSNVMDLAGNFLKDSVYSLSFRTLNPDTTGSVSGSVLFTKEKFLGKLVLNLKASGQERNYQQVLPKADSFQFTNVMPGRYVLEGFVDFDENGTYSYGNIKPFAPAEPYAVSQDTVIVRSRWSTENVILRF